LSGENITARGYGAAVVLMVNRSLPSFVSSTWVRPFCTQTAKAEPSGEMAHGRPHPYEYESEPENQVAGLRPIARCQTCWPVSVCHSVRMHWRLSWIASGLGRR